SLMEQYADVWKQIRGSEPVETFGPTDFPEPEPIEINLDLLIYNYRLGFQQFGTLWKEVLSPSCYHVLRELAQAESKEFLLPAESWAQTLYEAAATFHHWPKNRAKLIEVISPLYHGRVASFINQTAKMSTADCEKIVEEQAEIFEREKGYLLKVWEREGKEPEEKSFFQKVLQSWKG
ncbi:MAG: glycosyltransferase, partial [Candidatus Binatia bacterium]